MEKAVEKDLVENYVRLVGTVKADSTEAQIRAGLSVLNFSLVVSGRGNERPVYVDCMAFGDVAHEQVDGHLEKGEVVKLDGHLTYRTVTNHDGTKRSGLVVYVDEILEVF